MESKTAKNMKDDTFVNVKAVMVTNQVKFHTLAITIYRFHDLDLAVTIAKMVQNILETRKN